MVTTYCKDHMGNKFPNKNAMCEHYNIKYSTFKRRIDKQHMSLKDALTIPVEKRHNGSCKDHLGNEFPSTQAMCEHYGIDRNIFDYRIYEKHMPLKDALTKPTRKQHNGPCKDHLGNEFPNQKAMCKHYGISYDTFYRRMTKNHMSLEDALTTASPKKTCEDHLGNKFPNRKAMCKYYNIDTKTFVNRIEKKHMSLEAALTTPVHHRAKTYTDHQGNEFPSITSMCKHYGINRKTFKKRISEKHMSLKDALTIPVETPPKTESYKDHLGNEFPSMAAMCKHYGIRRDTFTQRIKRQKMSLKDALTTPLEKTPDELCKDHLGNEFPNRQAMCNYYGINYATFRRRIEKKHMSLKDALTTPVEQKTGPCKDHIGNEFPSQKAMCDYYGINMNTFKGRIENNSSIEEALGIIPYIYFKTKNARITDNLFIKEVKSHQNKMLYAICIYNNTETLFTHDEIIEIYRSETRNAP